jgi:hypothetical protein
MSRPMRASSTRTYKWWCYRKYSSSGFGEGCEGKQSGSFPPMLEPRCSSCECAHFRLEGVGSYTRRGTRFPLRRFCILYYVFCVLYYVLCILYSILCIMYYVLCILYYAFCILYSVLCTLYSVFCILYSVFCFLFSVFCFLFSIFWKTPPVGSGMISPGGGERLPRWGVE